MATNSNKEAKVKFTAETSEFTQGITNINKSLSNLKSDLGVLNTEIKTNGDSYDTLSEKQKTLQGVVENLSEKLRLQQEKLEKAKELFGENSTEADKLYRACNSTASELIKFTGDLEKTEKALKQMGDEAEEASRDVNELDNEMDDVESSGGGLKGVLDGFKGSFEAGSIGAEAFGTALGNLASQAITACIDAIKDFCGYLWDLPEATEEFRTNMAKLQGATEQYGYDIDDTNGKVKELYGYFKDEQVATNAITNLQGMKLSQDDLNAATDAAIAVWTAYGDSIPIESLTESINETSQVGKVTGSLADALNWAGISEDEFNKKLETCKTTQERAALITETLNGAYGESKTKFDENTESIRQNNEAQFGLLETESKLAEAIEPLKTKFTEFKADALEAMTPFIEKVIEGFTNFCDWCGQLKEKFDEIRNSELGQFFETLLEILGAAVWESIKVIFEGIKIAIDLVVEAFKVLSEVLSPVFEVINDFLDTCGELINSFVEGFKEGFGEIEDVLEPIGEAFNKVKEAFKGVFDIIAENSLLSKFTEDASGATDGAKSLGEMVGGFVKESLLAVAAAFILTAGAIEAIIAVITPLIQLITGDFEGALESMKKLPEKLSDICEGTKESLEGLKDETKDTAEEVDKNLSGINPDTSELDEFPVDVKKAMDKSVKESETGLKNMEKEYTGFNPKWKISKPDTKDAKQEGPVLTKELENGLKGWSPIWKVSKPDTKDATDTVTGSNGLTNSLSKSLTGWGPSWKVSKPDTKDATDAVTGSNGLTKSLDKSLTGWGPSWKVSKPNTKEAADTVSGPGGLLKSMDGSLTGWTSNWKISNPDTSKAVEHVKTSYSSQTFDTNVKGNIKSTEDKLSARPSITSKSNLTTWGNSLSSTPSIGSKSNLTTWSNGLSSTPSIGSKANLTTWGKGNNFGTPSIGSTAKLISWSNGLAKTPTISIIGKITSWIGAKFNADGAVYQYHARGGIMTSPTVFHIGGEAGAEAILPLDGFYSYLDSKLDTIAGGSTSVVNINLENVQIKDDRSIEDLADQLAFLIQRKSRF